MATHAIARYRHELPQLGDALFLTDGGLETTLIYHEGENLPLFAAFQLLKDARGEAVLRRYFDTYAELATGRGLGVVLETPTWRTSRDWGAQLGYTPEAMADINRRSVELLLEVRERWETPRTPVVISGNLGPRGDGYRPDSRTTVEQARDYHAEQIGWFRDTAADMVAVMTMTTPEEAAGVALAAREAHMPLALSFTLETDGRLPDGTELRAAIERVELQSGSWPAYYMINCAHPSHFAGTLSGLGELRFRVRGVRANASRRSHAELDASTDLDAGDPHALSRDYESLRRALPALRVVGGCCGTDHRHVAAIADRLVTREQPLTA